MDAYGKAAPTYRSPHNHKFKGKYWEIISLCECDDGCDECVDGQEVKKVLIQLNRDKQYQTQYKIVAIENDIVSLHKIKEIRGQIKFITLSDNPYIRSQVIKNIKTILNG